MVDVQTSEIPKKEGSQEKYHKLEKNCEEKGVLV